MSLLKVSTYKQPVCEYSVYYKDKNHYRQGRIDMDINQNSGIDIFSGIHRYILDEDKYAWLPVKEKLVYIRKPSVFWEGSVKYYLETMTAGHANRLMMLGNIFV